MCPLVEASLPYYSAQSPSTDVTDQVSDRTMVCQMLCCVWEDGQLEHTSMPTGKYGGGRLIGVTLHGLWPADGCNEVWGSKW